MGYINVSYQAVTFALSLGLGALMCLLYDVFRAMHKVFLKGFFEVLATDILFWGVSAFLTYCFLLLRCQGTVRMFVFVGQFIGFIVVRITVSKLILKTIACCFRVIFRVIKAISSKFYQIAYLLEKNIKKIFNKSKKHLQQRVILLYNQLKVKVRKN